MRKWIKFFGVIILPSLIISSANAFSLQEKCAEIYMDKEPVVDITYNYGQLKYDNSKNSEELGEIFKVINAGQDSENIHGLTYLEPKVTTQVSIGTEILDEKNFCFYPRKINIKVSYNPTIYIINSLQPGTCRFNTTVRHEQTHLDLGHHALYLFAKSLRENVPEILVSVNPMIVDADSVDGDKIVKYLTDEYHKKVKEYFEEFKAGLLKYNSLIDTTENYKEETKLCPKN